MARGTSVGIETVMTSSPSVREEGDPAQGAPRTGRSRVTSGQPVATVVLSPHMDDAVFSAWTALHSPGDVTVVTVCAGLPTVGLIGLWDAVTRATCSRDRVQERIEEDRRAVADLGRRVLQLTWLDAQYATEGQAGRFLTPANVPALVSELDAAIPEGAQIWAPAALGGHGDHLAVRVAAVELGHSGRPLRLYGELPYAVRFGWPAWVTGKPAPRYLDAGEDWRQWLAGLSLRPGALEPVVTRLPPDSIAEKSVAMRTYATQFPGLDASVNGRLSDPATLQFEVAWLVRPTGRVLHGRPQSS